MRPVTPELLTCRDGRIRPTYRRLRTGQIRSEVLSVMKFHKPQRMICFIQAETEGDTLFFVCSFCNFRKYTFNSCSRFVAKNVLQVTSELYTEIHFQGLAL